VTEGGVSTLVKNSVTYFMNSPLRNAKIQLDSVHKRCLWKTEVQNTTPKLGL